MRIVAGKFRGLNLAAVGKGDNGAHLRPTTDRVRENIFNMLQSGRFGDPVSDARVLDLFAGTGALGLEALSRGAAHVTFVDSGAVAAGLNRKNIDLCNASDQTARLKRNATRLGACAGQPFDLVFLDPPYGKNLAGQTLGFCLSGGWIAAGAVIVVEENAPFLPPPGFALLDRRKYGSTHIAILEPEPFE